MTGVGAVSWDCSAQRSGAFSPQRLCQRLAEQGKPGVFELGQCALCQLKTKKKTQRESCMLHLGQYEDCSPRDGPSDSSEKLPRGGRGRNVGLCVISVKGKDVQPSTYLSRRFY